MKVAIYARVSMDDTGEREQDPQNQVVPLKEWAKRMGWKVVGVYSEKESGVNPNRPKFIQMRKDARQRKFDAVLVWKLDRFSREPVRVVLAYLNELKRFGVAVRSMTENWLDTGVDNPTSELILLVMSWVAEQERAKISERTKAGIARRRNIGQWRGGRPKGSKDRKRRKQRVGGVMGPSVASMPQ